MERKIKRQNNLDLLRVISAVMVVIIHVNLALSAYKLPKGTLDLVFISVFDIFTRFCVPSFLMISGAFALSNPENKDYRQYYSKIFCKIVLPFLIISLFFFLFDIGRVVLLHKSAVDVLKTYVFGRYYNLWYMFYMIPIYLLVPVILRFKESVSKKTFGIFSVVYMILAVVSMNFSDYRPAYALGMIFSYLAYFLLGSAIFDSLRGKNTRLCGFFAVICFSLQFALSVFGIKLPFNNSVYFYPLIVAGSALIFIGFVNFKVGFSFGKLPRKTYFIYLLHTFIMRIVLKLIGERYIVNETLTMIILTAVIFALSYLAATVYLWLWGKIEDKFSLKEKFLRRFGNEKI